MAFYAQELLKSPLFKPFWVAQSAAGTRGGTKRAFALTAGRQLAESATALIQLVEGKGDHEPITLVVPAQLMSGFVRIHHADSVYLLTDCGHLLQALARGVFTTPANRAHRLDDEGEDGQTHRPRKKTRLADTDLFDTLDNVQLPDDETFALFQDYRDVQLPSLLADRARATPSGDARGAASGGGATLFTITGGSSGQAALRARPLTAFPSSFPQDDELFETLSGGLDGLQHDLGAEFDLAAGMEPTQPIEEEAFAVVPEARVESPQASVDAARSGDREATPPRSPGAAPPAADDTPDAPLKRGARRTEIRAAALVAVTRTLSFDAAVEDGMLQDADAQQPPVSLLQRPQSPVGSIGAPMSISAAREALNEELPESQEGVGGDMGLAERRLARSAQADKPLEPRPIFRRFHFTHHQIDLPGSNGVLPASEIRSWLIDPSNTLRSPAARAGRLPHAQVYASLRRGHGAAGGTFSAALHDVMAAAGALTPAGAADSRALRAMRTPLSQPGRVGARLTSLLNHALQAPTTTRAAPHAAEHERDPSPARKVRRVSRAHQREPEHAEGDELLPAGEDLHMGPEEGTVGHESNQHDGQAGVHEGEFLYGFQAEFKLFREAFTPTGSGAERSPQPSFAGLDSALRGSFGGHLDQAHRITHDVQQVMATLTSELEAAQGDATSGGAPAMLPLSGCLPASTSRHTAATFFAASLALMSRGTVRLTQPDGPYTDILLQARA